jgi:hypothetical protein
MRAVAQGCADILGLQTRGLYSFLHFSHI